MKYLSIVFTFLFISMITPLAAQSFDTEVISAELYNDTIQRTGKLDYKRTLALSFKSTGYLELLKVDEGDQFAKGQLLASLDVTELKEQKNSNYAKLVQAKREVKRLSKLMDANLSSERDLDTAKTEVEVLRAAYQLSSYSLEKAQIYAPFSGVVLSRTTELGELQSPGQTALKIAKLEWVVKVALTGQEVAQIQLGQKASISLSHVGIVEGVISKIPAMAGSNGNLFTIEILLPKIKISAGMIAGQLAAATIAFESNMFVYKLPISALVAVDEVGKAIVIAQTEQSSGFKQYSFEIFQIDNDYVYVKANRNDESLKIMTTGWQNFSEVGK
ncbi:MAG: multidrug efflux system membrane fusion protein [Colwellia sp.]|jgi:RND family efflux transporter MFP subunit